MLGAIAVWTAYTIIGRRAPALPPIASTAAQAAVTLVVTAPFAVAGGLDLPRDAAGAWSLVFIALFPSVLSYLLWNRALTVFEAGRAGVYLNLITVFTALATVLMGQPLHLGPGPRRRPRPRRRGPHQPPGAVGVAGARGDGRRGRRLRPRPRRLTRPGPKGPSRAGRVRLGSTAWAGRLRRRRPSRSGRRGRRPLGGPP